MKITSVEYKKSIVVHQEELFLEKRKEILFVWRSNVGKSSLLNALLWKKNMAYVSAMPGKTRAANVFLVNSKFFFTDLPGYGYARGGKEKVKQMDELITWYTLEKKVFVSCVVLLVDSKIGPQPIDIDMYKFLKEQSIPLLIVLTKIDRLSKNEAQKSLNYAQETFFWEKILLVSSDKRVGIEDIKNQIEMMLKD